MSRFRRRGVTARPPVSGGQLAAGVRASPGAVGYLGSTGALTVLNVGNTLPGGWSAVWDTGALVIGASNVTVDHYQINATVVFTGSNPTMTNCKVFVNQGDFFGVTLSGSGKGYLTVSDTTVVGAPNTSTLTYQVNGISSDSGLIATRCDVSQTGDGIHIVASSGTASKISQCYIHDQSFIDEDQHCDGIQMFNHETVDGAFIVEHTYVAQTLSTAGTPLNAALTCGKPPGDNNPPAASGTINNNFFEAGLYHLRINFQLHDLVVTNNNLGPVHSGEFADLAVEVPSAITTWSNNRNSSGSLIPAP